MNEETLFHLALGKPPGDRSAFLDVVCEADAELRSRVERLLDEHERSESFILDTPPTGLNSTVDHPHSDITGTVIGPYKLLQQIGEGGFGVVYMATQTRPMRRTVALKIIKPGMDSRRVIARFEAERQALAMMDHPNIARVLDAGMTDSGLPYFVMELVKGVPITKYCDDKQLPLRARLELFLEVCQAVQHAHQKGVIHRDIKPNNVLVAEYDHHAVPKVIDFGVAKATASSLTEKTMFTEVGQVLGTVEYMSPEQAKLNQLDIDTRSDIYSLGVLLYELLTSSTPFARKRLNEAAFVEMLRIIRDEEPPKPSTRLITTDALPSIAANRSVEARKLSGLVRGELDWIVMRALEKDRNRRYDTAKGLAADVQRYLNDEPVQACPPSAMYRFRKFARRNKAALATVITVAIAILVAVGSMGWTVRDRAALEEQLVQERAARQARVAGQLEVILDRVARLQQAEKWSEALAAARRAEPALAAGEAPPDLQERVRRTLVDLELVQRLDEVRAQSGTAWGTGPTQSNALLLTLAAQADQEYAAALRQAEIDVDALPVQEAVDRITARRPIAAALLPALDDWVAARSMSNDEAATRRLIDVLHAADQDPWRQRVRNALARKDWPALETLARSPDLDRQPAATFSYLSAALHASGKYLEEDLVLQRAQWKYPNDFWFNHRLGVDLIWRQTPDDVRDGIGFMRAAVALRPESSHAVMNLGNGYSFLREYDQAIACYGKALELKPGDWVCYSNLAIVLSRKGLHDEAIAAFEEAMRLNTNVATEAYAELSMIHSNRPEAHLRNVRRAAELAKKAVELEPQVSNHWTSLGIARYRDSEWEAARSAFEKSRQLGTHGTHGAIRWPDAIDWFFLAMSNWRLGQQDQARQNYDRAVQEMENGPRWQTDEEQLRRLRTEAEELLMITDQTATTPDEKVRLAEGCSHLARLFLEKGRLEQAERSYRQAIALREPLADNATPQVRLDQACDYNDMAFVLKPDSRWPESIRAVRTGLELKQTLVREFPNDRDYRIHVAHSYLGLGHIAVDSGRTSDAVQAYSEAAAILSALATDTSAHQGSNEFLGQTLDALGDAWLRINRPEDATQAHQRAWVIGLKGSGNTDPGVSPTKVNIVPRNGASTERFPGFDKEAVRKDLEKSGR